ncbi:tyrosine-type recombinase/integrase [Pseudomonas sp. CR3202]|uniref:tyrosine-type recombinase/integrase n=1 Tax=Pseudomonas sp. CR3202 TaxID=3351532 RepID=UPI003BF350E3
MCKQGTDFYVRMVLCIDGERLPTLVDAATGLPDFIATHWVVNSLRGQNRASATIEQALRSVALLYLVLKSRNVDLTASLRAGRFLEPADIEAIAKAAKQTTTSVRKSFVAVTPTLQNGPSSKIASLERLRMGMQTNDESDTVASSTASIRLLNIRAFLQWRANQEIYRATGDRLTRLIALRDLVDKELRNKTPSESDKATLGGRQGISRETQVHLLELANPEGERNPWSGTYIRIRNQLIINMIIGLGIRRSESLGMRVPDINPRTGEVMILRRPDDIDDPRSSEPNTKTRDRVLPLTPELYKLISEYLRLRHQIVRGSHDFLLVANSGRPLSKSELNRLFRPLDTLLEGPKLTPHVLRHTYFENLAEDLHSSGHTETQILYYLRRLGGWSETSDSPLRYTKRFVQEMAMKAGLASQKKLRFPKKHEQ